MLLARERLGQRVIRQRYSGRLISGQRFGALARRPSLQWARDPQLLHLVNERRPLGPSELLLNEHLRPPNCFRGALAQSALARLAPVHCPGHLHRGLSHLHHLTEGQIAMIQKSVGPRGTPAAWRGQRYVTSLAFSAHAYGLDADSLSYQTRKALGFLADQR
jgi:hypothetical protein